MNKATQKSRTGKWITPLIVILIAAMVFLSFNLVTVFEKSKQDQANQQLVSDLRTASYRIAGLARLATNGEIEAFAELNNVIRQMQDDWASLRGDSEELTSGTLGDFFQVWQRVRDSSETIIKDQETIVFLHKVTLTLNQNLPELQQEHTRIVELLLESRAPADQVAVAQTQSWRAERIGRNLDKMLAGGADAEAAADQFNLDANLFGRVLEGMLKGNSALGISRVTNRAARSSLEKISSSFEIVSNSVQKIFEATPTLFRARQGTNTVLDETPALLEQITRLSDEIDRLSSQHTLLNQTTLISGVVAIISLALIGMLSYLGTRMRLRETAASNKRNEEAILRLLDEISDLGDGNLTVQATVTEDFTGAIADSINYTVDQLRNLVSKIVNTAENVLASTNETRATALQLSDSSEHQAQEITAVSDAINHVAATIEQVSVNAAESAKVAEKSVAIANSGSQVVQDNIRGMDTIREQIQDTSKRIKRLGESSQEIGDIVSLISDIADQTNILALNAAIQASMAGDAGRGFAVVADEVQRLAERSAAATKQITALVKTIQTDTHEAVSSMESTTARVVKGADLAHNAGVALEEIKNVSTALAELIQGISGTAREQASSANQVSRTMKVIQAITSQTLNGTNETARSVGELAEMARELAASVSGFKLPDREILAFDNPAETSPEPEMKEEQSAGFQPARSGEKPESADDEIDISTENTRETRAVARRSSPEAQSVGLLEEKPLLDDVEEYENSESTISDEDVFLDGIAYEAQKINDIGKLGGLPKSMIPEEELAEIDLKEFGIDMDDSEPQRETG